MLTANIKQPYFLTADSVISPASMCYPSFYLFIRHNHQSYEQCMLLIEGSIVVCVTFL